MGGTGLAVMAFLGAGFTHTKGRYKTTVAKGLQWLAAKQKPSGAFPYATFYEQGIATIAVCEAYALTRSPKVGRMAQKAIDHIVKLQPDHKLIYYHNWPIPEDRLAGTRDLLKRLAAIADPGKQAA